MGCIFKNSRGRQGNTPSPGAHAFITSISKATRLLESKVRKVLRETERLNL
jgi:hypothetical protein